MDRENTIAAVKNFAAHIAKGARSKNGIRQPTEAQEQREREAARKLLRLILDREPTQDEIAGCLPWNAD